jgi:hypothetical protein
MSVIDGMRRDATAASHPGLRRDTLLYMSLGEAACIEAKTRTQAATRLPERNRSCRLISLPVPKS